MNKFSSKQFNKVSSVWKNSQNNIRYKLFFTLLMITLLPILVISGYSLFFTTNKLHSSSLLLHSTKIELISEKIERYLGQANSDLFYLRDSNALDLYLSAAESSGSHTKRLMLTNLRSSFKIFALKKNNYYQIRFIDAQGMEIVGIDLVENQAQPVSDDNLQDQKNMSFFKNSITLNKDELFVSTLHMRQFESIVVKQKPPTINYSTPVFNKENKLLGVITLNVDMSNITHILTNEAPEDTQIQFVSPEGFYFSNNNASPQVMSAFSDKEKISTLIKSSTSGNLSSDKQIITYKVIKINGDKFNLGILLGITPKNIVFKDKNYFLYFFLGVIFFTLVITFFLAFLLSDLITKPIRSLTDKVELLSKGDLETPIIVKSVDEIGKLTSAIERLRKSMKILMKRAT